MFVALLGGYFRVSKTATIRGCGCGCDLWYKNEFWEELAGPILWEERSLRSQSHFGFIWVLFTAQRVTTEVYGDHPARNTLAVRSLRGFGFTSCVGYLWGGRLVIKTWFVKLRDPWRKMFFSWLWCILVVKYWQKVCFIGEALVWGVHYDGAIRKLNDPDFLFSCLTKKEMDLGYHQSENAQDVLIQIRSHCKLHL